MKKFNVEVTQSKSFVFSVRAKTKNEAIKLAKELAQGWLEFSVNAKILSVKT